MLTLTETAAEAIRGLTSRSGLPESTGLRIAPQAVRADEDGAEAGFALSLADGPTIDDQVVEVDRARVFLEPAAADVLADMMLDAEVTEGGSVGFLLAPQGSSGL